MSPDCRTIRSPATTRPCSRARSGAGWPRLRRNCNDPRGRPDFRLGAATGPARTGPALRYLVRAGRALDRAGHLRPAAVDARARITAARPACRVLGRAAGPGLVLARRHGGLVTPAGTLAGVARGGPGPGCGFCGERARVGRPLRTQAE